MTIAPDLVAQILRLHEVEKWRVGTIARQLHVHRDTVRRVLAANCAPGHTPPLRVSRIDPYRPFILSTLAKFPTLTAARLHAMVAERATRAPARTSASWWPACARARLPRPTCACAPCRASRHRSTGVTSVTYRSAAPAAP
jgi:hypothetical protein